MHLKLKLHVDLHVYVYIRLCIYICRTKVGLAHTLFLSFFSENGSRKRKKACEFLLPEKRKKPVTVNDIPL